MRCIYCFQEGDSKFTNREHVLPQSFGTFKEDNFVLRSMVCNDCNTYFGKHLEIPLARDSYEGSVARYEYKIKQPEEFKSFGKNSRVVIKIEEGLLKGAYAYREYDKDLGDILSRPVPQVGFLRADASGYDFFRLDGIPSAKSFDNKRYCFNTEKSFAILGCTQEVAYEALRRNGFWLRGEEKKEHIKPGQYKMFGRIDQKIMRAVAKIGFNYLAYHERFDFVLCADFDSVRKYIRYGEGLNYLEPSISKEAITPDEFMYGYRRLGHIILINRVPNSSVIYASISLFNWATYSVCLTENCSDSRDVLMGHLFRISDREIERFNLRIVKTRLFFKHLWNGIY